MLTIAIPTYNRNQTLLTNLGRLLPQLTSDCRMLIIDNNSDQPVEATLVGHLAQIPPLDYRIVRNRANIGANANILRCFELCETTWLWVLGDDDLVEPTAISTILEHIRLYPDAVCVNFSVEQLHARSDVVTTCGQEQFVEVIDSLANFIFISTNIYRADVMALQLKFGYQYAYSMAPHLAVLLTSLDCAEVCCFSNQQIVRLTPGQSWPYLNSALGLPTLLELPLRPNAVGSFARQLLGTYSGGFSLRTLTFQLLLQSAKYGDRGRVLYFYDQVCSRIYYFDRGPRRRTAIFAYRLLLRLPSRFTALAYRLMKGRRLDLQQLRDQYTRL